MVEKLSETHHERVDELTHVWMQWQKETGDDLPFANWLIEKLIEAEERASHHAAIASVCSATAERYAAALGEIETIANANQGARITEIRRILKEARKEAE